MRADQIIENRTQTPIAEIHIVHDRKFKTDVDLEGARLSTDDAIHATASTRSPLQCSLANCATLKFKVASQTRGFENDLTVKELMPTAPSSTTPSPADRIPARR